MFKLLIECSKDIDNLSINFSDGTSVITETNQDKEIKNQQEQKTKIQKESKEVNEVKEIKEPRRKLESYLDTEMDFSIQQEVVQKPIIQEVNRPANVSDELQNLDL